MKRAYLVPILGVLSLAIAAPACAQWTRPDSRYGYGTNSDVRRIAYDRGYREGIVEGETGRTQSRPVPLPGRTRLPARRHRLQPQLRRSRALPRELQVRLRGGYAEGYRRYARPGAMATTATDAMTIATAARPVATARGVTATSLAYRDRRARRLSRKAARTCATGTASIRAPEVVSRRRSRLQQPLRQARSVQERIPAGDSWPATSGLSGMQRLTRPDMVETVRAAKIRRNFRIRVRKFVWRLGHGGGPGRGAHVVQFGAAASPPRRRPARRPAGWPRRADGRRRRRSRARSRRRRRRRWRCADRRSAATSRRSSRRGSSVATSRRLSSSMTLTRPDFDDEHRLAGIALADDRFAVAVLGAALIRAAIVARSLVDSGANSPTEASSCSRSAIRASMLSTGSSFDISTWIGYGISMLSRRNA